jgi:hypothetical protein
MLIGAGPFYLRQFLGELQASLLQQPFHPALLGWVEFADPRLQVGDDLPHRAEPQLAIFYTRHSEAPVIQPEQLAVFGRDAQPAVLSDPDKT